MSYKIIITETRTVKTKGGKKWEVIGTKEVKREPDFYRGTTDEPKTRIEEIRGYTPEIDITTTEEVKILEQTVAALDLPKIIKAINGL